VSDDWHLATAHSVTFKGTIGTTWRPANRPRLIVADEHLADILERDGLTNDVAAVVLRLQRPNRAFVDELTEAIGQAQIEEVVAVGSGALIDAAKVAHRAAESVTARTLDLLLVPCGPEPYRAVTAFAVVDDPKGHRPTEFDPRFAAADVLLVEALLAAVQPADLAVHALDTAVHAIESLFSRQANPLARALAMSALRTVRDELTSVAKPTARSRTRLAIASFLAAEAFATTRLGIAHALASPLGAELGVTHDTINGILGEPMVELWGAEAPGFADVAAACDVPANVPDVLSALAQVRELARLPASLSGLGISWTSIEAVLPKAAKSSGMSVLARQPDATTLERFAQRAWHSAVDQEVFDARTA
jgi:alcohol dehydrogenase class IV